MKHRTTPAPPTAMVWHRLDLRLRDHPALTAASQWGCVLPVFLWTPEEEGAAAPGGASKFWLHQSLRHFDASLRKRGSRLILRRGPALESLRALARETGATAVFWNRRYDPAGVARDAEVEAALREAGLRVGSFNGALLHEPEAILNRSGKPFQVFTPFWRSCLAAGEPRAPLPAPRRLAAPGGWPTSVALEALGLEPGLSWTGGIAAAWEPGEAGAQSRLRRFVRSALFDYSTGRNRPDLEGTSRLSPHLHFGEISPWQVWAAVRQAAGDRGIGAAVWRRWAFPAELGWREFAHHLLFHFPHTVERPLRGAFERFPWREDAALVRAWEQGRTGYPIVDAGMRELWVTGWMHNRVRMIAASFLVKDLLVRWQEGARWFWDTLVDADLAANTLGWQWTAGCGADAAPYFRIFNPTGQGERFDPEGAYVRRWIPALAPLPARWIHRPFDAPAAVLKEAGIVLGASYPRPVLNHAIARNVALDAYRKTRAAGG
ncbi:MAG: deoxyribodipyrimidine photo-lyase [Verrucomicrobia bacterium]|nr:deoxyribodipyrimidine photo-lyase [Verrucomicrobiota bacterium]